MKLEVVIPDVGKGLKDTHDLIIHLLFSNGLNNVSVRRELEYKDVDGVITSIPNSVFSCDCESEPTGLISEIGRLFKNSEVKLSGNMI